MLRTTPLPTPRAAPSFKGEKPVLEIRQEPIFRVHHTKLGPYLRKVYRTEEFDFLAAAGVTPGPVVEYLVNGVVPDNVEWRRRIDHIRSGRQITRYPEVVLNLLCREGFIPKGLYRIETKELPNPVEAYRRLLESTKDSSHEACVQFRKQHNADPGFAERADVLDHNLAEYYTTHPQRQLACKST